MRILVPLLVLSALATAGETVRLPELGLTIEMPDGWSRDSSREQGTVKFAAIFEHERNRFVRFAIETSPADGFRAEEWLAAQKHQVGGWLNEVTVPFERQNLRVGGLAADAFACGGKRSGEGQAFDLHFHVAGVVHGAHFIQIAELSYNNAHNEKAVQESLEKMWNGVKFGDIEAQEGGVAPPAQGEPQEVKDEGGNYTVTLPPGWLVGRAPPEDEESQLRATLVRPDAEGHNLVAIYIWRIRWRNPRMFSTGTPTEVIESLDKNDKFFEPYYGEGSATHVKPIIDEGTTLGDVNKSGAYEYRSITMEEQQNIRDAEDQQRRGIKDVTIPEYKETVVRGRLALLSPYVYLLNTEFRRDLADDPQLLKEFNQVLDSFKFLESEALPQPLEVNGEKFGDTTADPANQEERKETAVYKETGRKTYRIEDSFVLPPGFQRVKNIGGNTSFIVVAQDAKNNWFRMRVAHQSWKALSEQDKVPGDKKTEFASWKSNWESTAKNTKIPSKTKSVRIGNVRGEGYEGLEGEIEKFRATFTGMLDDKSSWRTIIEIETRGDADEVFKDEIKKLLRSLKVKPIK